MSTYKDVLLLVDKVSAPLKKVTENLKKATETSNKMSEVTSKLNGILDKAKSEFENFQGVAGKIGNVVKNITSAFAAVSGAVTAAKKAIISTTNKYADYADRIDKISQQIGMSKKAFQEWDYIMAQNGGSVESLRMGYKTLANQMNGVQKGSKESIKAFSALGVNVKDNTGKFRTQDEVFNDVVRALQKETDETKKAVLGNQLFGRSFIEMKFLLNQSAEAIDNLRETANKKGLVISDKDIENAVRYKDTMDTFSRFFEAKFAGTMMKIMPELSTALEDIMQLTEENQQTVDILEQSFKQIASTALPATVKAIFAVVNGMQTIAAWIGTLIGNIMSIPTKISMAFNTLKTNIIIMINQIGKAFANIASQIKQTFLSTIQNVMNWLQNLFEKLKGLMSAIPGLNKLTGGGNFAKNIAENITGNRTNNDNRSFMTNSNNTTSNVYNTTNNYNSMFPFTSPQYAN